MKHTTTKQDHPYIRMLTNLRNALAEERRKNEKYEKNPFEVVLHNQSIRIIQAEAEASRWKSENLNLKYLLERKEKEIDCLKLSLAFYGGKGVTYEDSDFNS